MTGYEFVKGPHQDVPWLIEQVDLLFDTKIVPKGGKTKLEATVAKVMEHRGWEPAAAFIRNNLPDVLNDLGVFYVPKQLAPGPAIVFPQVDIYGKTTSARMRPLYDLRIKDEPVKYAQLGVKNAEFAGPGWLGNTPSILDRIITTQEVILPEGFFDIIACRAINPQAPILSTATKGLGDKHIDYLRILGVKRIHLLYDNERSKKEGEPLGQGERAARHYQRLIKDMDVQIMRCPAEDPSACLTSYKGARDLRLLLSAF